MELGKDSTTPRQVIWLTCADLYMGGVKGCHYHEPDELGEHDCDCADHLRCSSNECARPEVGRVAESRFGLRLCCACAGVFERYVTREASYSREPHLFHRLPVAERQVHLRRALARVVRACLFGNGDVGTWAGPNPSRARQWRTQISIDREEAARVA